MTLSRKDFLRKGLVSLAGALLNPSGFVDDASGESQLPEDGSVPRIGIAKADNSLCLAQRGGCFTCLERCPEEAIAIEPGMGIRIDTGRCKGCGACQGSCPLEPVAIRITPAP